MRACARFVEFHRKMRHNVRMITNKIILPEELMPLAPLRQWVVHRGKIPFDPCDLTPAKSNAPETWGTLQDALTAFKTGDFDGIGFEFGNFPPETLRVSGIDLDHVVRDNGTLEPFAEEIVNLMDSYTEYSPSGNGLHIVCRTVLKDIGRKKGINTLSAIEMYNYGRYFTVAGKVYGTPKSIEELTVEFNEIYEKYFSEPVKPKFEIKLTEISDLNDEELLEKMFASKRGYEIQKLFNGDWSSYPSQSEADLALVSHLIFWTQQDEVRTDELFRQSGLYRDKWERTDYRIRTMEKALRGQFSVYDPKFYFEHSNGNINSLPLSETEGQNIENYLNGEFSSDSKHFEKYRNLKTGFTNLDELINLYPGLYVLGAISSLGKTTFACQLADQLAKAGEHVLYFSLEQSKFELITKGLSRLTARENLDTAVTAINIREGVRTPAVLKAIEEYKTFGKRDVIYQCGFETTISTILDSVKNYIEDNNVKPVVILVIKSI